MIGVGKMFQVASLPEWWCGNRVPSPLNLKDALFQGGLDWDVALAPLALLETPGKSITQRRAVVRCDKQPGDRDRVIGVVHPKFVPLQNAKGAALFDDLLGAGGNHYVTGGYLYSGERVWLQAQLREPITVGDDDKLNTYLLYSNSHDGTRAIDIRMTTVRVWCENTLNDALRTSAAGVSFRRAHNKSAKQVAADADLFFRDVLTQQARLEVALNLIAARPCHDNEFKQFLERVLAAPAEPASASTNEAVANGYITRRQNIKAAREAVFDIHVNGLASNGSSRPDIPPAPKTWWGSLNSFTAWVDHKVEIKGDRFAYLMFGEGDRLKRRAYALVREQVGVPA